MSTAPSSVVELRQYTLHPGQRDVLIELFEREFVESQEALGMAVLATFRDLDRPERFVWFRGFRDMPARAEGLTAFYGGPVWKAHRDAANATMIDSDNVLLLRPARADAGFAPSDRPHPPKGATDMPKGIVVANLYPLAPPAAAEFADFFEAVVRPAVQEAGAAVAASYVTETAANNFPRLPVREGEAVFVWLATFAEEAAHERWRARLVDSPAWPKVAEGLERRLVGPPEVLRLQPTSRSAWPAPAASGSAADFDFLIGDWTILHRRLRRRLVGDDQWIEFSGPFSARKVLGGLGNFDECRIDLPEGTYIGATLRLFNPGTGQWSISWMDSRNPRLDPPMVGTFADGRGLFYGEDTFEGKPIRVRFIWSPKTETGCRWEQAFSADEGRTWETNWSMTFTRESGGARRA